MLLPAMLTRRLACALLFCGLTAGAPPHTGWASDAGGRLLVQIAPDADHAAVVRDLRRLPVRHPVRSHDLRGARLHLLDAGNDAALVAAALAADPRVRFVEPDRRISPARLTVDPLVRRQRHLALIHAPAAWRMSGGGAATPIAILDSGIDADHPDLAGRVLPGWNAFDDDADTRDVTGHGTLVAGAAAAAGDNGLGGSGVTRTNPILPVRVTDADGNAYLSTLAAGLVWAADHGARVANVSFAIFAGHSLSAAAEYFVARGGLVFAAGGNDGAAHPDPPNEWIISVAATGRGRVAAPFSSRGLYIDLAAPGVNVFTTAPGGGYARASGTSLASPIAAGVAALVLAISPDLSPWQVEAILEGYAVDLGSPGFDSSTGWGRVDAARAVDAARRLARAAPE